MPQINKERLIQLFCRLAKIPSPSGQEEAMAQEVIALLAERGLSAQRDSYGNIIAKLDGAGEPLIFCAHLDTVAVGGEKITPIVQEDKIVSDGKTILGADNKDAVAAILEALQVLKETKTPRRALEIVFTREEEAISRGAQNLDYSLLSGKECFIADHAEPYGTIVLGAPHTFRFDVEIKGVRAHVKNPERGASAVLAAARAINRMPLGRIDELTTANVAFQVGGLKGVIDQPENSLVALEKENRNTVPDLCFVFGEARGVNLKTVEKTLRRIEDIFQEEARVAGAEAFFRSEKTGDGYYFEKDDPLILKAAETFRQQGAEPIFHYAVGGSDANALNARGVRSVVVSSSGKNNHQCSEYLIIEDFIKLADFFLRLAVV